jgi:hypothetical protein
LASHVSALQRYAETLPALLGSIEDRQYEHEQAERRQREYEIDRLESKVATLQRGIDALHTRLDMIHERDKDEPGVRRAVEAFMSSFRA